MPGSALVGSDTPTSAASDSYGQNCGTTRAELAVLGDEQVDQEKFGVLSSKLRDAYLVFAFEMGGSFVGFTSFKESASLPCPTYM